MEKAGGQVTMEIIVNQIADKGTEQTVKYLILSVNGYIYAIRVSFVSKIVVVSQISALPREESYILGVAKLDKMIYTVVDLRILFGGENKTLPKPMIAVLLAYGETKICAVVDSVLSVIDIDTEQIICPLEKNNHISGVVQINSRSINILSMDCLFLRRKA